MPGYSYNGVDYDENGNPIGNPTDTSQYGGGATTNTGSQTLPPPGTFQTKNPDGSFSPLPQSTQGTDAQVAYYRNLLGQGMSEEDAINATKQWAGVPNGVSSWTNPAQAPVAQTTTTGSGGSGFGGGFGGSGSLIDPFTQSFTAPSPVNLGGPAGIPYIPPTPNYKAPVFTPPTFNKPNPWSYDPYTALDANSVKSEPGYQFGMDQGEQALLNAKAAQGIAGTGATLKAILGWGGDYATGRYNDAEARNERIYGANRSNSLDAYNTNYQTQYTDPYKFAYQGAMDAFAPQMAEFNANVAAGNMGYQTQAAAGQRANEFNYNNAWNQQLFDYNKFRDQRDSTFDKQYAVLGM